MRTLTVQITFADDQCVDITPETYDPMVDLCSLMDQGETFNVVDWELIKDRTFSEVALCHLPDDEIQQVFYEIDHRGRTSAYRNDAGFFVWAKVAFVHCPVLTQILAAAETDYVLFDRDVEPDPELEIYNA